MTKIQEQSRNDEIDPRELLTSLWVNKFVILAITVIFSIGGIAYALLAPQKWSAKAVIVAPLPTQMEQLQLRIDTFVAMTNINGNKDSEENNNDIRHSTFLASFSELKLYTDFIQSFNSYDNKSEFLKKNGSQQISISVKKGKKDAEFVTLLVSSDNAEEAKIVLNEYIDFIQNKEVLAKNKLLVDRIINQINVLTFSYQNMEKATLKMLQNDIISTQYALRISKAAGIDTPVENLNNQSFFAIDLGAKALSEKLNILKEIKDFEFINPDLTDTRLRLDSLKAIPQEKALFSSYHFLQSPAEPLNRDSPKRSLVVVLSTLLGITIGVMFALLRIVTFSKDGERD